MKIKLICLLWLIGCKVKSPQSTLTKNECLTLFSYENHNLFYNYYQFLKKNSDTTFQLYVITYSIGDDTLLTYDYINKHARTMSGGDITKRNDSILCGNSLKSLILDNEFKKKDKEYRYQNLYSNGELYIIYLKPMGIKTINGQDVYYYHFRFNKLINMEHKINLDSFDFKYPTKENDTLYAFFNEDLGYHLSVTPHIIEKMKMKKVCKE